MTGDRAARLRRWLLILCPIAALWAVAVVWSDGFVLRLGSLRLLSSRSPQTAAVIAVVSGLAALALTTPAELRQLLLIARTYVTRVPMAVYARIERSVPVRLARRLPAQTAPALAGCAAVAVVTVAMLKGAPYVGGSDVYGYVSQAHLWATGTLRVEQPFVNELKWPFAAEALTPMAYRATEDGAAIVPIYPPGFPMLMAVFERLVGREAVFVVVPLVGGLAVWATYLMGARLAGRTVGAAAAVLLATSPVFLFQLMFPMSDVPVTAWWALSLALLPGEDARSGLLSGLAAGAAILTRPNLALLAVIPFALLAWRALQMRSLDRRATSRAVLFVAGVIPACLAVAIVNTSLYGSPLASGYGSFDVLYQWKYLMPNLARYPRWLLQTQTPLVMLALIAPLVLRSSERTVAVTWLCFVAGVFLSYYSGRLTVRYDAIPPEALDDVVADLRRLDYHPYIVLEQGEEEGFRKRFVRRSGLGELDWAPAVLLDHATKVRIYDPADREAPGRRNTIIIR